MSHPEPSLPLVARAKAHGDRPALSDAAGRHSYDALLDASGRVASGLLDGRADLQEDRVAFLLPPSFDHVAVQWGIWRAGGVAVPLALSHPPAELEYTIRDAAVAAVVGAGAHAAMLEPIARAAGARWLEVERL